MSTDRAATITVTTDHGTYSMDVNADGWPVEPCSRCYGTGHYSFNGYDSVCYLCGNRPGQRFTFAVTGAGSVAQAQADYAAILRRRANDKARRDAARERKAQAAQAAIVAARESLHPAFAAHPAAVDITYYPNLLETTDARSLRGYEFAWERYLTAKGLTDRVLSIAAECTARFVQAGNAQPWEAGRQTITGTIASLKLVDSDYGSAWKAVVALADGRRVYGTLPRAISEAQRGDLVEFTATVAPADDDAAFGFYSRPTKARLVNA